MSDITEGARAEAHDRFPVWHEDGLGMPQGKSYRSGFVAGAEWAEARSGASRKNLRADWLRAKEELAAAREALLAEVAAAKKRLAAKEHLIAAHEFSLMAARKSIKLEEAARLGSMTDATRESLILQVADVIAAAPIHLSSEGHSIVGDPSGLAMEVLDMILAPGIVGFEAALQVSECINKEIRWHENRP